MPIFPRPRIQKSLQKSLQKSQPFRRGEAYSEESGLQKRCVHPALGRTAPNVQKFPKGRQRARRLLSRREREGESLLLLLLLLLLSFSAYFYFYFYVYFYFYFYFYLRRRPRLSPFLGSSCSVLLRRFCVFPPLPPSPASREGLAWSSVSGAVCLLLGCAFEAGGS